MFIHSFINLSWLPLELSGVGLEGVESDTEGSQGTWTTISIAVTLNILTKDMLGLKHPVSPWQVVMNKPESHNV